MSRAKAAFKLSLQILATLTAFLAGFVGICSGNVWLANKLPPPLDGVTYIALLVVEFSIAMGFCHIYIWGDDDKSK